MRVSALPSSRFEYEPTIRLLRADPELAGDTPKDVLAQVEPRLLARAARLTPGHWDAPWLPAWGVDGRAEWPLGGLLVLEGLLLREVRLHGQGGSGERAAAVELLGPGDLLRPWQDEGADLIQCSSSWRVFEAVRFALLDRHVLRVAGEWPEFIEQLLERCLRRARWLTVATALNSAATSRERLVLCFEHLADRWGRVTPAGIVIRLPLTHRLLAQLTEMTRPTCTSALSWLARKELVSRRPGGEWLLRPDARKVLPGLLLAERGRGDGVV